MNLPTSDSSASKTHILSLTYAPKIEAVKAGEIKQTIRSWDSMRPKKVGDKLILHTWSGKPYRTPWGWRLETKLSAVLNIGYSDGDWFGPYWNKGNEFLGNKLLSDVYIDSIARLDGIEPPTREGLENTLMKLNGLKTLEGTLWDVLRW